MKLDIENLKKQISSEIKTMKLDDILDSNSVSTIAMRLKNEADYDLHKHNTPKGILPEGEEMGGATIPASQPRQVPFQPTIQAEPVQTVDVQPQVSSGEKPTDVAYQPEVKNKPEVPYEIQNKEPVKLFVFSESELVQNGVDLGAKYFRTINDPNVTRSMYDIWMNDANLKAEIYLVKFEKIGNIDFDYTSSSANLHRESDQMDVVNIQDMSISSQPINVEVPKQEIDIETVALNAAKEAIKSYQMNSFTK